MCDCEAQVNKSLLPYNTRLERRLRAKTVGSAITLEVSPVLLAVEKIDAGKRGKPMLVTASYCPFCGQQYPTEQDGERAADG